MNSDSTVSRAFTLIELLIVISIIGLISAIAIPKFADAGSGRRLSAAKRVLVADIEMAKLRARATSKIHVIKFIPNENRYIIVEGTDVRRQAVILSRNFADTPYLVEIASTNLGGGELAAITLFGDVSPAFDVVLQENGTEAVVSFDGLADLGIVIVDSITLSEVKALGVNP